MQRPTGVTVIAVLDFIGAGICVLFALLIFAGGSMVSSLFTAAGATGGVGVGSIVAVAGVIVLLIGALAVAIGIGLLKLKNWARILSIVFAALGLVQAIRTIATVGIGTGSQMAGNVIGIAFNVFVIWYMLQANVKAAFTQPSA